MVKILSLADLVVNLFMLKWSSKMPPRLKYITAFPQCKQTATMCNRYLSKW